MSKQLIEMIEAVAYEKGMPMDVVRESMESAIASLARKEQKAPDGLFRAKISPEGEVRVWRVWEVVDNVMDEDREVLAEEGQDGGTIMEEEIPTPKWTRQGLQVVKQVLAQRMKQGLRKSIATDWKNKVGEVVMGVVKRIDKGKIVVDLGEPVEGVIAGRDRIPGETFRIGNRVRAYVSKVDSEGHGSVITLSRTCDEFLAELIAIEVPEIDLGQVIIKSIARDPGSRAKIAIQAGIGLRTNPASACIGMRGIRAQAVSSEINGERLEFIDWSEDPAQFIINAMSPAEITTMIIDENEKKARIGVSEAKLARAIGARGQNVRLASKLTGWTIDLMSVADFDKKSEEEQELAKTTLMEYMDMDEEMASILVEEGFTSIEEIYMSPIGDLLAIEGVDEELVEALQERAEEALKMLADMERAEEMRNSLEGLTGISQEEVELMKSEGVTTLQELADIATDEISWPEEQLDKLGKWIMEARSKTGMI